MIEDRRDLEHSNTATTLNNLVFIYHRQGRIEETEPLCKRALEIREKVLDPEHPNTAQSRKNLPALYSEQWRYEEAEQAYADAVAAFDETHSCTPDYTHAYSNKGLALVSYGDLLAAFSRHEEPKQLYAESMEAYDEVFSHAPDYINAHNGKGNALRSRGDLLTRLSRHREAERAYADAVAAYDEVLSCAPDYIGAHYSKALALLAWEASMRSFVRDEIIRARWEAAQSHCEQALTLAPQLEHAEQLLSSIGELLHSLDVDTSTE